MAKKKAARKSARKPAARKTTAKKTATKKTVARKSAAKKSGSKRPKSARRTAPVPRRAALADVKGASLTRDVGGVRLDVGPAGAGRVKRMVYPPGFSWSRDIKPHVGTDYCMHAHVGFLVQGRIDVIYEDGCIEVYEAPHIVAVAPGHDGHVVGNEPAVLIEFDFEGDTIQRFGMPEAHRHD